MLLRRLMPQKTAQALQGPRYFQYSTFCPLFQVLNKEVIIDKMRHEKIRKIDDFLKNQ